MAITGSPAPTVACRRRAIKFGAYIVVSWGLWSRRDACRYTGHKHHDFTKVQLCCEFVSLARDHTWSHGLSGLSTLCSSHLQSETVKEVILHRPGSMAFASYETMQVL